MLNNKGQVLVFFVLLIPIFLLILVLVIDIGNVSYQKNALNNICNLASEEASQLDNQKLEEYIKLNDDKINSIIIENDKITLKKQVEGIISQIVNIKVFKVETTCKIERNNQGDINE